MWTISTEQYDSPETRHLNEMTADNLASQSFELVFELGSRVGVLSPKPESETGWDFEM